ncbi:hypothetical protein DBR37_05725 [Herminiimonas sp. KBW02]|nr:hypothetical protein DBR37_05725 [Herminiimonas sp. KBW02]
MQIQIGNARIEASGAYVYIKAFGREVFVKREPGQPWQPHVKRHTTAGLELWGIGLYAAISK